MQIRQAAIRDLDGMLQCAKKFHKYAKYTEQGLLLDEGSFNSIVKAYIINPKGIVLLLVDEKDGCIHGMIAGAVFPWSFNKNIQIMLELFYWVDPECRGLNSIRLYKGYEKLAREKGAEFSFMVSVATELQEGVNRLYLRNGYVPQEQFFMKRLERK